MQALNKPVVGSTGFKCRQNRSKRKGELKTNQREENKSPKWKCFSEV